MRKNKESIRTKLTAFIVLLEVLLALAAVGAFISVLYNVTLTQYKNASDNVLLSVRECIPAEALNEYARTLEEDSKYSVYETKLSEVLHTDASLVSINILLHEETSFYYLFAVGTNGDRIHIGNDTYFAEDSDRILSNGEYGNGKGYMTYTQEHGLKYTVNYPLSISDTGEDILVSMSYSGSILLWELQDYAAMPTLVYLLAFLCLLLLTEVYVRKMIIRPIDTLAKKAKEYMKDGYDTNSLEELRTMPINSYEEFENLRDSMVTMGENIEQYIESIRNVTWESEHDAMTMLHNRAKFRKRLEEEYPYVDSIYIAYLDVNNLKEMNDMFGHTAGDAIILKLAEKLRLITSDRIHTYRWGGDEFLVVMCDYSEEEARNFMESWHKRIGRLNRKIDPIQCTVAYGGAYARGEFVMETIVDMADDAMYRTKSRQKLDERMKRLRAEKTDINADSKPTDEAANTTPVKADEAAKTAPIKTDEAAETAPVKTKEVAEPNTSEAEETLRKE